MARPKKKKCLLPLSRPSLAFTPRLKTFLKHFLWKNVYLSDLKKKIFVRFEKKLLKIPPKWHFPHYYPTS